MFNPARPLHFCLIFIFLAACHARADGIKGREATAATQGGPAAVISVPAKNKLSAEWAAKFAAWDADLTLATTSVGRLKLCRSLHTAWATTHPGYTTEQAVAYLAPIFDRVIGYEINDATVFDFIADTKAISVPVSTAFLNSRSKETVALVNLIAADRTQILLAKQQKTKAPVLPPRIKVKSSPATAASAVATLDLTALRQRAAGGDGASAYDLGAAYLRGQGIPTDPVASRFWINQAQGFGLDIPTATSREPEAQTEIWRRLAEQGSRTAQYYYGTALRDGRGVAVDVAAAHRELKKAAAGGQREAMVVLAQQYRTAQGSELNLVASRQMLEEAAAVDHPPALAELGWTYEAEAGVARDLTKAAGYYRRAAERGHSWAMGKYAGYLLAGHGLARDEGEARRWLEKAAAAGDKTAKATLAELLAGKFQPPPLATYTPPRQSRPDFPLDARRQQAEAGDAAACYDLAFAYWYGLGVLENVAEGDRWFAKAKAAGWQVVEQWATPEEKQASWRNYGEQGSIVGQGKYAFSLVESAPDWIEALRRAAEAGYAPAQNDLGERYRDGRGLSKDLAQAFGWFRRAADIGHIRAQTSLGFAYESGGGVLKNPAESTRWYRLATEGGEVAGTANYANNLTKGLGLPAEPRTAAGLYMKLAGLSPEPIAPEEAAALIRAKAEAGDADAFSSWAMMLRRGVGVKQDNEAAFAYGFLANSLGRKGYELYWYEFAGLRRAPASRQAAKALVKSVEFAQQKRIKSEPEYAAKLANGETPDITKVFANGQPDKSVTVRALRAIEDGTLEAKLAGESARSLEPFALTGLDTLVKDAGERSDLSGQPWLLRLAGVAEQAADAAAVEKLFQASLLAPATDDAGRLRLRALRRLAAARMYYGIGRAVDRPAALAWSLVLVSGTDSLLAVEMISRELSAEQIASADELYERIAARVAVPAK